MTLLPPPTTADQVAAATRDKDARRNGNTRAGRTDMMAGAGDLFAGARPEQMQIPTTTGDTTP